MQTRPGKQLGFNFALLMLIASGLSAQSQPNTNVLYQQLRNLKPGGDVINVSGLTLKRDAAIFTFQSGSFAFYGVTNNKETGAVFIGSGHIHITPPTREERHNLLILNHTEEFDEDFDQALFRFTDDTAAELRKASTGNGEAKPSYIQIAQDFHNFQRMKLHNNYDLRILEDVQSAAPGGFFLAALHSRKNAHLLFIIDPHGVSEVAPEEVALHSMSDWGNTILLAFHSSDEYHGQNQVNGNELNATTHISSENLDATIEKNGFLTGLATVEIKAATDGVAVIPLNIYRTLRVSKVETASGEQLEFIQEKKEEDPDFGVVLKSPLKKDESVTLRIAYGGKDVVMDEGGANYYPVARESWYPNSAQGLGDYVTYKMTFHVPRGLELIATGTKLKEYNEGKYTISEWKSDVPIPVVGFNLGKFKMKETQVQESGVQGKPGDLLTVNAYANESTPDNMQEFSGAEGVGNINTASMLPLQLSEGAAAAEIYSDYFGELPFSHVALTQQFACGYGQSWPMLVYLPICGFFDSTQQHFLGLHPEDMYWKVVTAHEVAHQWWGQTVGFRSYRDQWMSEGFANTSASIFLQLTRKKPDDYRNFWKEQRRLITEKNQYNFRPIDVGPVTMGIRLMSPKAGWNIYQDLVYPKGAYILHMVRQMMWSPNDGDTRFKATMHELIRAHKFQAITTEDFKAAVEKFMSPAMDLDGNHKMDWFFNEYVYGTALPSYHFENNITREGDLETLHIKLTQSNVTPEFRMAVPLYLELANGNIIRMGSANVIGNSSIEKSVALPKMTSPVKRVMMNYYYDVLCTEY